MERENWTTPYGDIYLQTEQERGEPRFYFAEWHSTAKPPLHIRDAKPTGCENKATMVRRIEKFVATLRKGTP